MKKYRVIIEETCAKEFDIVADDPVAALDAATKQYREGVLALEPGELHSAQASIIFPNGGQTEWTELCL